jgi:hypothetical protein
VFSTGCVIDYGQATVVTAPPLNSPEVRYMYCSHFVRKTGLPCGRLHLKNDYHCPCTIHTSLVVDRAVCNGILFDQMVTYNEHFKSPNAFLIAVKT